MNTLRKLLISLSLLALSATSIPAQEHNGFNAQPLRIQEAFADFDEDLLYIVGESFGTAPTAWLGEMTEPLPIVRHDGGLIVANLPELPPGSYRLQVTRGSSDIVRDTFDLTLGAAGPPGVPGLSVHHSTTYIPPDSADAVVAECPADMRAISGGWKYRVQLPAAYTDFAVIASRPHPNNDGNWEFQVANYTLDYTHFDHYVTCAETAE